MIVRRDELRASKAMQNRVFNTPNIEVLWNHETLELQGEESGFMKTLKTARLINNKTKEEKVIDIDGFFLAIGHKPNSELFEGVLDMDEVGYIKTKPDSTATNIPGIYACGDVQDNVFRQAVTAAGTGCMAALEAERFLAAQND